MEDVNFSSALLLDSGASCHIVGSSDLFKSIKDDHRIIKTLKHKIDVYKTGSIKIGNLSIPNVLHVPKCKKYHKFPPYQV